MKQITWVLTLILTLSSFAWSNPKAKVQLETQGQVKLHSNAINLIARWNHNLMGSQSGQQVVDTMKQSGIFSEDVQFNFDLGGQKLSFNGLDSMVTFYDDFFSPLKKPHFNWSTNVEVLEVSKQAIKVRFRHGLFLGGQLSLAGDNQATIRKRDWQYQISEVLVTVVHFDIAHAH